jgi:hypothetical protein
MVFHNTLCSYVFDTNIGFLSFDWKLGHLSI